MGGRKMFPRLIYLPIILLLGFAGCSTNSSTDKLTGINWPRIHTIGSTAILNFEKGKDISIPIEGQNLQDPASDISVSVEAPYPLLAGVDYYLDKTNAAASSALIFLNISKSATTNLNSKDHLLVNVAITERPPSNAGASAANELNSLSDDIAPAFTTNELSALRLGQVSTNLARQLGVKVAIGGSDKHFKASLEQWLNSNNGNDPNTPPGAFTNAFETGFQEGQALAVNATNFLKHSLAGRRLSSDSRTFILFTPEDYRSQVLANQIEIQNITAFPLPESETKKMFGDFVSDKFYAVRLTLLNPTKEDQIVSLGLIKAYGRALVEPAPIDRMTRFTRPIEIAPQSEQQVYTMVQSPKGTIFDSDDLGTDRQAARDWIFGSLEFAGAMAAAYGTGFGASEDYLKAVALATGAGIPGLDKLFADKRPFYLLNIVNFAMPDLVKIPRGGSLDGKYLFFSKGRLQAVLQDPQLKLEDTNPNQFNYATFFARVIYLEFDTLQIPFENTTETSGTTNLASQVELLRTTATATLGDYGKIQNNWQQIGPDVTGALAGITTTLTADAFNSLQKGLTNALQKDAGISATNYAGIAGLTNLLLALQTSANLLKPASLTSNLWTSADYGQPKLTTALNELQNVETGLLQGQPDSLFQNTVDSVAKTVNPAQAWLAYYKGLADEFQNDSKPTLDLVAALTLTNSAAFTTNEISLISTNAASLNSLLGKQPKPPVSK